MGYFNEKIETMSRGDLDALIEERIRYTVKYAGENSPFYKKWFKEHKINPLDVRTHEDLRELPIISGKTIREQQPPETADFQFRCVDWKEVFTLHETSGTSGTPKAFFLTWQDWERYAEKYARSFVSQGFGTGDRVIICASYGMNIYDPALKNFVSDGECGRVVLTTLLPVGGKSGTLLLNYDSEDTSIVVTRKRCACGRTHMKITNPQRESETFWVAQTPFNRVDVERGVFQRDNMEYLTGEYEAFLYGGDDEGETILRVSVECLDRDTCDRKAVEDNFLRAFFNFAVLRDLELYRIKGRPKRLMDRR